MEKKEKVEKAFDEQMNHTFDEVYWPYLEQETGIQIYKYLSELCNSCYIYEVVLKALFR